MSEMRMKLTRNLLQLQQSGKFCDIQLLCVDGIITAHSAVLSSSCTFFSNAIEHTHMYLPMMDFSVDIVQHMVKYLYTGYLEPPKQADVPLYERLFNQMGLPSLDKVTSQDKDTDNLDHKLEELNRQLLEKNQQIEEIERRNSNKVAGGKRNGNALGAMSSSLEKPVHIFKKENRTTLTICDDNGEMLIPYLKKESNRRIQMLEPGVRNIAQLNMGLENGDIDVTNVDEIFILLGTDDVTTGRIGAGSKAMHELKKACLRIRDKSKALILISQIPPMNGNNANFDMEREVLNTNLEKIEYKDANIVVIGTSKAYKSESPEKVLHEDGFHLTEYGASVSGKVIVKVLQEVEKHIFFERTIPMEMTQHVIGSQGKNIKRLKEKHKCAIATKNRFEHNETRVCIRGEEKAAFAAWEELKSNIEIAESKRREKESAAGLQQQEDAEWYGGFPPPYNVNNPEDMMMYEEQHMDRENYIAVGREHEMRVARERSMREDQRIGGEEERWQREDENRRRAEERSRNEERLREEGRRREEDRRMRMGAEDRRRREEFEREELMLQEEEERIRQKEQMIRQEERRGGDDRGFESYRHEDQYARDRSPRGRYEHDRRVEDDEYYHGQERGQETRDFYRRSERDHRGFSPINDRWRKREVNHERERYDEFGNDFSPRDYDRSSAAGSDFGSRGHFPRRRGMVRRNDFGERGRRRVQFEGDEGW